LFHTYGDTAENENQQQTDDRYGALDIVHLHFA
jgi:hypothetical protein